MNNTNLESIFSTLLNPALDKFQAWAIQHPEDGLSQILMPIISFVEGMVANDPTYLDAKRQALGPNFLLRWTGGDERIFRARVGAHLAPSAHLAARDFDAGCQPCAQPGRAGPQPVFAGAI